MRAKGIATREQHRRPWIALASAWSAMVLGEPAWPADDVGIDETAVELSEAEITARAQVAAVDLADSLRSVGSSLRSAGSISAGPQGLTQEENHQLVESAVKDELDRLTRDLDDLSGALAVDRNGDATATLLQSIARRKANLIALAHTTQKPLIPADELRVLAERWKDLEKLSVTLGPTDGSSLESAP